MSETSLTYWLSGKKPPKVLTPYERLDRNLKVLMQRFNLDKGNILVGDTITFKEEEKPHCIFYPTEDKWMLIDGNEWNLSKRYTHFKGGARKFLNWYDKQ